ncbi:unnamed protein product, partial [Mesorhabditis belari]|uniref:Uncharacterized protein n=1 Tax=Mesorhabditis belari TaxID=2138241 RepID=A0AAF3F606_9BILA
MYAQDAARKVYNHLKSVHSAEFFSGEPPMILAVSKWKNLRWDGDSCAYDHYKLKAGGEYVWQKDGRALTIEWYKTFEYEYLFGRD